MLTLSSIRQFPKAELHCHLDGSILPETLQKIAKAQDMWISDDLVEVSQKIQAPENCQHLEEYLAGFSYVLPYLQTTIGLEMAAYDVLEQAYHDGVRYIEIRFAPSLSLEKGLSVSEVILAVGQGVAKAEQDYPIIGNLIISGMRNEEQHHIRQIFEETGLLAHQKVVAIDLAGPEEDDYVDGLSETVLLGLAGGDVQLTLHAGECGCVTNVTDAISLGAKRIGHGIALKGNKSAQELVVAQNVCIEGCPTSNVDTNIIDSYADYPIKEWLDQQVPVCINTDNRTVSRTTLSNEYYQLVTHCGLTESEFRLLNQHAVTFAFVDDLTKKQLLQEMNDAILS